MQKLNLQMPGNKLESILSTKEQVKSLRKQLVEGIEPAYQRQDKARLEAVKRTPQKFYD